jgi:chromosome segregation ATPase
MSSDSEDLLLETRKLLNALNHENAELKDRNRALAAKVRDAEEAVHDARRSEKDLERDSKQLNFSLMQQVQTRTEEARAAAAREQDAVSKMKDAVRNLEGLKETLADLDARHSVAREQLRLMEGKLEAERRRASEAEADAARSRQELETALAAQRDHAAADSRSHHSAVVQLREQLSAADRRIATLEQQVDETEAARVKASRDHAAECSRLREAAQRTLDAESESAYAHDQMLSMADHVTVQYEQHVQALRAALRTVLENDAAIVGAMQRVSEQRAAMQYLRDTDVTLHQVLRRSVDEVHEATSATQGRVAATAHEAQQAKTEARREASRALDLERAVARLESELEELRVQRAAAEATAAEERRALAGAKADTARLDGEVSRCKLEAQDLREVAANAADRLAALEHAALQERAQLMGQLQMAEAGLRNAQEEFTRRDDSMRRHVAALQEENDRLRRDLHSHTASLAAELQRLQHGATYDSRTFSSVPRVAQQEPASFAATSSRAFPFPSAAAASAARAPFDPTAALEMSPVMESREPSPARQPPPPPLSRTATSSRSPSPGAAAALASRILSSVRPLRERERL